MPTRSRSVALTGLGFAAPAAAAAPTCTVDGAGDTTDVPAGQFIRTDAVTIRP